MELLELRETRQSVQARSTALCAWDDGYRVDYDWTLSADWTTQSLGVTRTSRRGMQRLALARDEDRWLVDGVHRPDFDGVSEVDLSSTPLCNTLPIRRLIREHRDTIELDVAYVNLDAFTVVRSRQRYRRIGPQCFEYADLGVFAGFTAAVQVDASALVVSYEGLFERLALEMSSAVDGG